MTGRMKGAVPSVVGCYMAVAAAIYLGGAFVTWDMGWLGDIGEWKAFVRLFVLIEYPLVSFLIWWVIFGRKFLARGCEKP